MMNIRKNLWLFCILAAMSGCFSPQHYTELLGQINDVKQLKANDKKQDKQIQQIEEALKKLHVSLGAELRKSGVTLEKMSATSVKLTLPRAILFGSGSARLDKSGRVVLSKVSDSLQGTSKGTPIRIVGYTDSTPIGKTLRARYRDNWALSSARAAAVARFLIWSKGIDRNRIRVEGRADTNPVADNNTAAGREKNRRIEIFIGKAS